MEDECLPFSLLNNSGGLLIKEESPTEFFFKKNTPNLSYLNIPNKQWRD